MIIVWAMTGPIFQFNDTWQLVINTGTTIITFLMVFLIQNTQNRDTEAMHIKINELTRARRAGSRVACNVEAALLHVEALLKQAPAIDRCAAAAE